MSLVIWSNRDYNKQLSPSKTNCFICFNESSVKMIKKCFLFHFKNSFRSEDIWIFVLTFCSFRKNSLFRKLRLRLQSLYCPISHKVKAIIQWMKYGQVIEYNKRNIFLYTDWQISLRKTYKLHQIKPQRYPYTTLF